MPLTAILLALSALQQAEGQRAAARIQQARYCAAVEVRAQHREVERVQPVSPLEPGIAVAQHKLEIDRLLQIPSVR